MFGNVWEWTADIRVSSWDECKGERGQADLDRRCDPAGLFAAVRGGSFCFDLQFSHGSERHAFPVEFRRKTSGFRCARDLEEPR